MSKNDDIKIRFEKGLLEENFFEEYLIEKNITYIKTGIDSLIKSEYINLNINEDRFAFFRKLPDFLIKNKIPYFVEVKQIGKNNTTKLKECDFNIYCEWNKYIKVCICFSSHYDKNLILVELDEITNKWSSFKDEIYEDNPKKDKYKIIEIDKIEKKTILKKTI